MKILVLGGTGAMGKALVQILSNKNNDIYVTSRQERNSDKWNVLYIKGNAMDNNFIEGLLGEISGIDAIIDFMNYSTEDFSSRYKLYLEHTKQYIFVSSARVYANSMGERLTEESPLLIDQTGDLKFRNTDEYALAKAREEKILASSGRKNWTIIRPYITYDNERLQLGVMEKEFWLNRVINGKTLVFSKDMANKYTTMTYGRDVSIRIADLIGNSNSLGEVYNVMTSQTMKWIEILDIYLDILSEKIGINPKVYMMDDSKVIEMCCNNKYQIKYDRLYDRYFDNEKILSITKEYSYTRTEDGLYECLSSFLDNNLAFKEINWKIEGAFDRITGEKTKMKDIPGLKNKIKYILYRYFNAINIKKILFFE